MTLRKFIQGLSRHRLLVESLLATLVAVSVVLNYYRIEGGPTVVLITMLILAGFYFIGAYFGPGEGSVFTIIATKVISISSSICVIGILYTILKFSGATQLVMIGTISLVIAGIILLISAMTSWNSRYLPILLRVIMLAIISGNTLLHLLRFENQN